MHDSSLQDQTDTYVFTLTTHLAQSFCKYALKILSQLAQVPDTKKLKAWSKMEAKEYALITNRNIT